MKMTKGDKIKLRAELAGKAMQGLLSNYQWMVSVRNDGTGLVPILAMSSVEAAAALMAELGISIED